MEFHGHHSLPKRSKMREQIDLDDPAVTLLVISERGYVSTYTEDHRRKALLGGIPLRPGDLILALVPGTGLRPAPTVVIVDDHTAFAQQFGMKLTDITMTAIEDAQRRAWRACAEAACPRCGVEPWQYCRNEVKGVAYTARFHRARQDASGATDILEAVELRSSHWQNGVGQHPWTPKSLNET